MFEDATFDARGAVRGRAPRWMMVTAAANAALVAGLIVAPLLTVRSLPLGVVKLPMYAPPTERVRMPEQAVPRSLARPVIALPMIHTGARTIAKPSAEIGPEPIGSLDLTASVGPGGSVVGGAPEGIALFRGSTTVVKAEKPAVARVSGGVVEGLLLPHATPSYPAIAKSAGISGDVVLAAVISREGRVENLRVVSGNPMLRDGAIAAVREWRYRPYLLDGKAVEVETTITIRFSLQGR